MAKDGLILFRTVILHLPRHFSGTQMVLVKLCCLFQELLCIKVNIFWRSEVFFLCREAGGEERKEGSHYRPSLLGFSILIIPIQSENSNATW